MKILNLNLITIDGVAFSGEVSQVTVPTTSGEITVLPSHTPLISELAKGVVVAKSEKGSEKFEVTGGVLEVRKHSNVVLLADSVKSI